VSDIQSRASTHSDECWAFGPGHYECAKRKISELQAAQPGDEWLREAEGLATHLLRQISGPDRRIAADALLAHLAKRVAP